MQPTEAEYAERGRLLAAEIEAHNATKERLVATAARARELADELAAYQAVHP